MNGAQNASLAPSPEKTPITKKTSHETSLLKLFPSIDEAELESKVEIEEEKEEESHFDASTIASSHVPPLPTIPASKPKSPSAASAVAVAVDPNNNSSDQNINLVTLTPVGTLSPTGAGVVYVAETVAGRTNSGLRPVPSNRSMENIPSGGHTPLSRSGRVNNNETATGSFYGPIQTNYNSSSFYQVWQFSAV